MPVRTLAMYINVAENTISRNSDVAIPYIVHVLHEVTSVCIVISLVEKVFED